jgi:3D (Asp-Asp-Asp) domain-containing protein
MRKYNIITVLLLVFLTSLYTYINYLEKQTILAIEEALLIREYQNVRYSDDYNVIIYPYSYNTHQEESVYQEPTTVVNDPGSNNYPDGGFSWLISKTQDGVSAMKYDQIEETLDINGDIINQVVIPYSTKITEMEPNIYSHGSILQENSYFYSSRATSYGVDCVGCSGETTGFGGFSVGVQCTVDSVKQQSGVYESGVQYEGYYIIATSQDIPLCTIVEISNHGFSGQGINYNEPFKAIVLDRGGAIKNSRIDFYVGSEKNMLVSNRKQYNVRVEILDFNSRYSYNGNRGCNIQYEG